MVPLVLALLAGQAWVLFGVLRPGLSVEAGAGDLGRTLLPLALILAVGRLLLSFLPAGRPGGHALGELGVTLAVSYVLGGFGLWAQTQVLGGQPSFGLVWTGPWLALALVRWLTLPGDLVPGHAVPHERSSTIARAGLLATGLLVLWLGAAARPGGSSLPGAFGVSTSILVADLGWIVVLVLVAHGLREARRAPLGRTACVLLVALAIPYGMFAPIGLALGATFLVPWLRRADRRACWLSAIGFLATGLGGEPLLALLGLFVLVVCGPPEQGREAFVAALVPGALVVTVAFDQPVQWQASVLASFFRVPLWRAPLAAFLVCLLWLPGVLRAGREPRPAIDEPGRESIALLLLVLVALGNVGFGQPTAVLAPLPLLALFTGLVATRTERVTTGSGLT